MALIASIESYILLTSFITLFSHVCMLGGAGNKPDSIWNYVMFVLATEHCRFKLKQCTDIIKMK